MRGGGGGGGGGGSDTMSECARRGAETASHKKRCRVFAQAAAGRSLLLLFIFL